MLLIEQHAIKTIVGMHEKFNDEAVIESIEKCFKEIQKRLDRAVPFTGDNLQHIWGYMQKVIILTEEIYRYFKVEALLPRKNDIKENTRYIGIVRRSSGDWYNIDIYLEDVPREIYELGASRYLNSLPSSDQYNFFSHLTWMKRRKEF